MKNRIMRWSWSKPQNLAKDSGTRKFIPNETLTGGFFTHLLLSQGWAGWSSFKATISTVFTFSADGKLFNPREPWWSFSRNFLEIPRVLELFTSNKAFVWTKQTVIILSDRYVRIMITVTETHNSLTIRSWLDAQISKHLSLAAPTHWVSCFLELSIITAEYAQPQELLNM